MIKGLGKMASRVKEMRDAQGQEAPARRNTLVSGLKKAAKRAAEVGAAARSQEAPAPRRPFAAKGIAGAIKTVAEKIKEGKLQGMKKGGIADKSGRAMKRKTADTKGRAMKKGK